MESQDNPIVEQFMVEAHLFSIASAFHALQNMPREALNPSSSEMLLMAHEAMSLALHACGLATIVMETVEEDEDDTKTH